MYNQNTIQECTIEKLVVRDNQLLRSDQAMHDLNAELVVRDNQLLRSDQALPDLNAELSYFSEINRKHMVTKNILYYNVKPIKIELSPIDVRICNYQGSYNKLTIDSKDNHELLKIISCLEDKIKEFTMENVESMSVRHDTSIINRILPGRYFNLKIFKNSVILLNDQEISSEQCFELCLKGLIIFDFIGFSHQPYRGWFPQFKLDILYLTELPLIRRDKVLLESSYLPNKEKKFILSKYLIPSDNDNCNYSLHDIKDKIYHDNTSDIEEQSSDSHVKAKSDYPWQLNIPKVGYSPKIYSQSTNLDINSYNHTQGYESMPVYLQQLVVGDGLLLRSDTPVTDLNTELTLGDKMVIGSDQTTIDINSGQENHGSLFKNKSWYELNKNNL